MPKSTSRGPRPGAPRRESHEQATVRMVNDPRSWPHLVLPLKKWVGGECKLALLASNMDDKPEYVIYRDCNLFGGNRPGAKGEPTTPEQVLAEGWLVD